MVKSLVYSLLLFVCFMITAVLSNSVFEDYLLNKDDILAGAMLSLGYYFGLQGGKELSNDNSGY